MSTHTASAVVERIDQALPGWQANPRVWSVPCPVNITLRAIGIGAHLLSCAPLSSRR